MSTKGLKSAIEKKPTPFSHHIANHFQRDVFMKQN